MRGGKTSERRKETNAPCARGAETGKVPLPAPRGLVSSPRSFHPVFLPFGRLQRRLVWRLANAQTPYSSVAISFSVTQWNIFPSIFLLFPCSFLVVCCLVAYNAFGKIPGNNLSQMEAIMFLMNASKISILSATILLDRNTEFLFTEFG